MNDQKKDAVLKMFGPYTLVRQIGDTYYISGQIGVNPDTGMADSDLDTQVHQALKNLGRALASVELSYDSIVKTTMYLTDMSTFSQVNEVYVGYFTEPRPARTTVGVAALPNVAGGVALVFEIEAIAVRTRP